MNKTIKVRDLILGDGIPKVCVPVVAHTYPELERSLAEVGRTPYELVEFRADFYFDDDAAALKKIRESVGTAPVIYTLRTKEEGGEIEVSDEEYEKRILAAAPYADIVDVQTGRIAAGPEPESLAGAGPETIVGKLQASGVKVIGSWHCFTHTPEPEDIITKMVQAQDRGCDISKAAVMPRGRGDVLKLMSASVKMLEKYADRPFITMSMGNTGRITRAGAAFTGSCITFGMAQESSAPGQIPAAQLKDMIRALTL